MCDDVLSGSCGMNGKSEAMSSHLEVSISYQICSMHSRLQSSRVKTATEFISEIPFANQELHLSWGHAGSEP